MGGVGETAPVSTKILHQAALAVCFLCLWITIARTTQNSRLPPVQIFWRASLTILAALVLVVLILQIPGDFIVENTPAAPIVHVKSTLLSTILAGLGFILVQRFGQLVRFRRTRRSEREWSLLMLFVSITFVAVAPFHHHFDAESSPFSFILDVIASAAILGSIIFIGLNIIRFAWILRLPVKQKMGALGLGVVVVCLTSATLLLLFRPFSLPSVAGQSYPIEYLSFYSLPLMAVTILFITFAFIYGLTSVLSMIFHLPTIGDYQRSVDEMAAMQALTVLVREVADPEKLYHWVVSTPVDSGRGKAAWLTIQELDSGSLKPQIVAAHNIEASIADDVCDVNAIHGEAARTRTLVSIQNTSSDRRIQNGKTSGIMSLLAIPLTTRTEVLGTLFVSRDVAHAFENEDIESIGVFASQATLVLENARLLEAQFERERLASELAIAHDVQRRLLPQTMPRVSTLSLAASSTAAQEVGGDYYDLLELGDGKLAFIIADVSGKGTSAAFYMAEMQGIFQAVAQIAPDPHDFLCHVNNALGRSLEKNVFVTAIYGVLDCTSGAISIARAGHPPAAFVDVTGRTTLLRSGGLGIGLDRSELFAQTLEVKQHVFNPGDLIALYTDGVTESRNPEGEEFGYDRLLQSIQSARYERAQGVHDAVLQSVDQFLGPEKKYLDDLTVLIIKWHGPEPAAHNAEDDPLL
ncbi:MAG: SpoIIE family protein phosphatase [Rhodothermaceae bacterium]|nr:SpoIIE family protein phosphatase [Rhodothermaceae bacterium]